MITVTSTMVLIVWCSMVCVVHRCMLCVFAPDMSHVVHLSNVVGVSNVVGMSVRLCRLHHLSFIPGGGMRH